MNKKYVFIGLIAAQILYLFFIILGFYSIEWFGKEIRLKTEPRDPRDIFHGDYVVLNYEINEVSPDSWKGKDDINEHDMVYAVLDKKGDYYEVTSIYPEKPSVSKGSVVLKSHSPYYYEGDETISLNYNIEQYYVEENTGLELEKKVGKFDVLVKVAPWGYKISSLDFHESKK